MAKRNTLERVRTCTLVEALGKSVSWDSIKIYLLTTHLPGHFRTFR